jgi:hypothetical protein
MLQWLYTYVASVYSNCFIYFRRMLQVFYLNVAYVAVATHMLHWLYTYVASVCSKFFICFRHMLQEMLSCCKYFMSRCRWSLYARYGCCKSRSGCRICCNGYTHMLRVSVLNVSSTSDIYCKCFLSGCCICCNGYTHML